MTRTSAHVAVAALLADQVEDLRLHGDVERRGRLVGEQQLRPAGQGDGDHHPLAHAARQLVRVLAHPPRRLRDAHVGEQSLAVAVASPRAMPRWTRSGSATWSPTRISGFSEPIGSWNTIAIARAPQLAQLPVGAADQLLAVEADRAGADDLGAGSRPMIERLSTVLPDPDSPTMPTASPRSTVSDTPSTARTSPGGAEVRDEVGDLEHQPLIRSPPA